MLAWHRENPERSRANMDRFKAAGKHKLWWKENRRLANAYAAARRAAKRLAFPKWGA